MPLADSFLNKKKLSNLTFWNKNLFLDLFYLFHDRKREGYTLDHDFASVDVTMDYVTAFIGPSGCGKSTFLRTLNRMNDTIASARVEGARV